MKKFLSLLLSLCLLLGTLPLQVSAFAGDIFPSEGAVKSVTLEDLAPYPRLSYEQGDHNAFYFSEEIQSTLECAKDIHVCDRATLFNLLIGLNGYTICSGVINESLNGKNIVAVPLNLDDYMEIGYLTRENVEPSLFAQYYIDALKKFTMQ